jgi:hypothetical protein
MPIIKDGKTYYTLEECIKISDIEIEKNAKKFAKEVIRRQKEIVAENMMYV